MSEENKKVELSAEELDAVTGGEGSQNNPWRSGKCWFTPNGSGVIKDGRMECNSHCMGMLNVYGDPAGWFDGGSWYVCNCYGKDKCVNRWHLECGVYKRF